MDMSLSAIALVVVLAASGPQQSTPPPSAEPVPRMDETPLVPLNPAELGVSIEKIQRALARRPAIKLPDDSRRDASDLPLFRVSIEERKFTISEILGPEFWKGPAPYGGMTHQEFLNMVTPKDVQGYAPFSNAQAATVAITSFALQWGLKTAIRALQDAKTEREREQARQEVQEALDALRKARREAGLPDK
jgi:hypothetical protein